MADTLILGYHALSPDWPASLSIPPERFEQQAEHVLGAGYAPVTFTEAVTQRGAGRRVAFTFDDGFRSVVEYALPILQRHGAPATVFVPTSLLDNHRLKWSGIDHWLTGPHEAELTPLSWADARMLVDLGWEVGSHTRTHPHLTELDPDPLREELAKSRRACEEQLGVQCHSIAYPYGSVNPAVIAATAAAGYRTAAGLPVRLHRRHELNWPRIGVFSGDHFWRFRAKISRTRRWLIGWEAGEGILRLQRRLLA
jgi:peptidoglycan/xylan/chitin deacetylase (PgdA/CDA1 family)